MQPERRTPNVPDSSHFAPGRTLAFLLLALFPCGAFPAEPAATNSRPLRVVTSILPVYCFTHQIAGGLVRLDNLLAAGADAHDFQFSRRERQLIDAADLLIVNGLAMEQWLEKALKNARPGLTVTEAAAGVGTAPGAADAPVNPHVWLDPVLACRMVTNISRALQAADPPRASQYSSNALVCVENLAKLHEELQSKLARVRGVPIVTYHDAFAHFARRYELRVVGVIEEVPDVEPSLAHLGRLARAIREQQVKVIFTEPHHAGKVAYRLGRDLNVAVAPLDTLENGPLRPDAYEAGMRSNLRVLERYLK